MRRVINRHGFTHVLTDCYANDPWISDPAFIAETMLEQAAHGSVAVIHMPERGFREYNFEALQRFLAGLPERGLRAVTLTELHDAAVGSGGFREAQLDRPVSPLAPKTPSESDLSLIPASWRQGFHKACWKAVSSVSHRAQLDHLFPATLCYYSPETCPRVRGVIALTVDDAPCRQGDPDRCMAQEVQALLEEFSAKATFFLCTDFVADHKAALQELLRLGHEVANHCPEDRSYASDSEALFEAALLEAERVCEELRRGAAAPAVEPGDAGAGPNRTVTTRWFRAPLASMSNTMRQVINRHGFAHVLADCYANDPWISDTNFIAETMLSQTLIHMPERGFREYNLEALRVFLQGVTERGFRVVTLSRLHDLAYGESLS
eukprot:CAMPEP_0117521674 /NCGR_PEP_ID=MMETSP0784-20121206/33808_1 /TAXON_ID=39447 /ORGANISM="" /LENGTH=377 /DNA_ID=CAMNT_0005317711 /DNA_START=60 /DNA_END=1193 /DNA_ORIENTATION=-